VNEHVLAAIVADHEAEALLRVEELHDAGAFTDDLGGHAVPTAEATTAAAAEPAAAAEAATTAEAAAAPTEAAAVTAAEAAATETTTAEAATEVAAAETAVTAAEIVALVAPTSAAIAAAALVVTHTLFVFPVRPIVNCRKPRAGRRARLPEARIARASSSLIDHRRGYRDSFSH
jgi:hypothetical protein